MMTVRKVYTLKPAWMVLKKRGARPLAGNLFLPELEKMPAAE